MKKLFTAHKILSLIVAVAIIMSGVPATAVSAADTATAGVTAEDSGAETLDGEEQDSVSIDGDDTLNNEVSEDETEADGRGVSTPGNTAPQSDDIPLGYSVVTFAPLPEDTANQLVTVETDLEDLNLPDSLGATVSDGDGELETTIEGVTWFSKPDYIVTSIGALEFVPVGTYVFTPKLPERYTLLDGVDFPFITVEVQPMVIARAASANVNSQIGLEGVASTGGTATLTGDISMSTQLTVSADMTIDLDGHTLKIDLPAAIGSTSNGIKINGGITLTIKDSKTSGTLTVINGAIIVEEESGHGAGINTSEGKLIIESGTINAKGGGTPTWNGGGAGIGGGDGEAGGEIIISGSAKVTATGGYWSAGIGGGGYGNGGKITISGNADVTATSGAQGAGIGGGGDASADEINISGNAKVTAVADGGGGAGIGGGNNYSGGGGGGGGIVTISGGIINAKSGDYGAQDIGSGANDGPEGTTTITGGSIITDKNRINGLLALLYPVKVTVKESGSEVDGATVTQGSYTAVTSHIGFDGTKQSGVVYIWLPTGSADINAEKDTATGSGNLTVAGNYTGNAIEINIASAPTDTPVTFTDLTANGTANITDTTVLTLSFSPGVPGLAGSNITVTGATKGTLTDTSSGNGTAYTLDISGITVGQGGNVNVAVSSPSGYSITPTNKDVAVHKDTTPPTLSAGSVNRTSDTAATIGFTTTEAGTAHYLVQNSGTAAPSTPVSPVGGSWFSLGPVSGMVSGKAVTLTVGEKDIYVVVTDAAGNVSTPLKITAEAMPTYSISLDKTGTQSLSADYGYVTSPSLTVTVTNTGNQPSGSLSVALSGTNNNSFSLSKASITDIPAGNSDSFTVSPIAGLGAGAYSATVSVSGANITAQSFIINFTVNKINQGTTLTVNPVSGKIYGDAAFQLATSGGNGIGGVSYTAVSGPGVVTTGGMLTITGAGDIVVNATKAGDTNYNAQTSADLTITIAKKQLFWSGGNTVSDKTYDGTNTATVSFAPSLAGVVSGDESVVIPSIGTVTFASKDAGTHAVTASDYDITGSKAANYFAPATQPVFADATISPAPLTITGFSISKAYDGNNDVTGFGTLSFSGLQNSETANVNEAGVTATYNNANAGTSKAVTFIGSFSMTGGTAIAPNYTITQPTGIMGTITAATGTVTFPSASGVTYGQTLNESTLSSGSGNGAFVWADNTTVPTVSNSGYDVVFSPSDVDNYDYSSLTGWDGTTKKITRKVSIDVSPRDISNADIAAIGNKIYTGSPITPIPDVRDGSIPITIDDYTVSYSANNTNVGSVTVTLTGKNNYTGTKTASFSIVAATLTGTPTITVSGDTLKIGATLTAVTTPLNANGNAGTTFSYQWKAGGMDVGTDSDTYIVTGSDAGKLITVTVTATGNYTGSQTSNETATVPYTVVVNGYSSGGDSVTAQEAYKNAGETINIAYTLTGGAIMNKLDLGHGFIVTTPATSTVPYVVNASHAVGGVITFSPVFTHQSTLTNVNVSVTAPTNGAAPQSLIAPETYYTGTVAWNGTLTPSGKFAGNTIYTATVTLTAQGGASFDSDFILTVNGNAATKVSVNDATVVFTYTFPRTPTKAISGISVDTHPLKTTYYAGDMLDLTGLKIKVDYDDTTTDIIGYSTLMGATFSINGISVTSGATVLTNAAHNSKAVIITYSDHTASTTTLAVNKLTVQLGAITGGVANDSVTLTTVQKDVGESVSISYTLDSTAIINKLELGHGLAVIITPATSTAEYVVNASHASGGVITFSPVFTHQSILMSADVSVTVPANGAAPQNTITTGSSYYTGTITWDGSPSVFMGDTIYIAKITMIAQNGAAFNSDFALTVNGNAATKVSVNGTTAVFTYTFPRTPAKAVKGISVKTQPMLVYVAGDKLNLSGLVVTVAYDDSTTEDIAYNKLGITYEINGTGITSGTTVMTKAAHDGKTVAITYEGKNTNTNALTVYTTPVLQISVADIAVTSAKISFNVTNGSNSTISKLQVRNGNTWADIVGTTSPYTATLLTPGTSYEYRVWAQDVTTGREYTSSVTFRTGESAPAGITVDGTVIDPSNPASITVTLEHGNTAIASVTIAGSGTYDFSFSKIPNGVYNLVSDNGSYKVTQAVTVSGVDVRGIQIDMSGGNTQSVVDIVTADTPPAAADGLPDLFNDTYIYTSADETLVNNKGTVEIKLAVERKNESEITSDAAKIDGAASGQTVGLYLDLSVIKSQFDETGALLGQKTLTGLFSKFITITFELPDSLKGESGMTVYRVHNGIAEALSSIPNPDGETAEIAEDIVTLKVCKFSTYAIAYTPSTPPINPPNPPSSGGSSGSGGNRTDYTTVSTYWIEVPEAKTMAKDAKDKGLDYARSRRATITGIRKNSLLALAGAGLRYQHDSVDNGAVQVRVYIDEPGKAAKDILVSGYVKDDAVDKVKSKFEKWFANKISVVSFDAQGDFGIKVQIAAKVDLSGMDTNNLYFYGYDRQANKHAQIRTEYRIDANGYLHFATILAGDIIISNGPLSKETQADAPALTETQDLQNPNTGGDSVPPVQIDTQNPGTGGDYLYSVNSGEVLKLEIWDSPVANGILESDPSEPVRQDIKGGKPSTMLIVGIAATVLLVVMMLWAVIPRKEDPLVSVEEHRRKP